MADNTITVVGNVTRDPELKFLNSGQAAVRLIGRREPSLAEPPDPGVGGADVVVLRGPGLRLDGGERRELPRQGHPGHRDRPHGAAQLGDRER